MKCIFSLLVSGVYFASLSGKCGGRGEEEAKLRGSDKLVVDGQIVALDTLVDRKGATIFLVRDNFHKQILENMSCREHIQATVTKYSTMRSAREQDEMSMIRRKWRMTASSMAECW